MQLSLDAQAFDQMKELCKLYWPMSFEVWLATYTRLGDSDKRLLKQGQYIRGKNYGLQS
jgi:hypothetical protein